MRLCSNRFKLYLTPVVYSLKLIKISGLYVLLLLKKKKKKNNPQLTSEVHPSLNKCQQFCWDPKLCSLLLLTFRAQCSFSSGTTYTNQICWALASYPAFPPLCQFFISLISSHKSLFWGGDCIQPRPWTQEKKYLSVSKSIRTSLLCQEERGKRVNTTTIQGLWK